MNVYIFEADLYCESCTLELGLKRGLFAPAARDMPMDQVMEQMMGANGWASESDYDSDEAPKGPFDQGGGEADSPQHCGGCGLFLENPLTQDGYSYVAQAITAAAEEGEDGEGHSDVEEWARFYEFEWPRAKRRDARGRFV